MYHIEKVGEVYIVRQGAHAYLFNSFLLAVRFVDHQREMYELTKKCLGLA